MKRTKSVNSVYICISPSLFLFLTIQCGFSVVVVAVAVVVDLYGFMAIGFFFHCSYEFMYRKFIECVIVLVIF